MKFTTYKITFTTGKVETVSALCSEEAMIIAQANQIQKGNSYYVVRVERVE